LLLFTRHSIGLWRKEWFAAQRNGASHAGHLRKICKEIREILDSSDKYFANRAGMLASMAKIIPGSFQRPRLPRSLLRDGWWLETRSRVIPFAKPRAEPGTPSPTKPRSKAPHLTLVRCGN
jgi:hypothetical protein